MKVKLNFCVFFSFNSWLIWRVTVESNNVLSRWVQSDSNVKRAGRRAGHVATRRLHYTSSVIWRWVSKNASCKPRQLLTFYLYYYFLIKFFLLLFSFKFLPWGMKDLSYPPRDGTRASCTEVWSLNHWTTKEVPPLTFFKKKYNWNWKRC